MILRTCARIFVSPFQFLFLFRASDALVSRGPDASSRVACARRRVSVDKVLQLKPSVALTKSNNALLHVAARTRFRSAQPFHTSLRNAPSVPLSLSLLLSFASAFLLHPPLPLPLPFRSTRSVSSRRYADRRSDLRTARCPSSWTRAASADRIVAHSVEQARSPST